MNEKLNKAVSKILAKAQKKKKSPAKPEEPKEIKKKSRGAPKGNKYAVGNSGRPPSFKPEYTKQLIEFFDIEPFKMLVTESATEYFANGAIKKDAKKTRPFPNKMPTLYRFSRKIGVAYTTVWRWAEKGEVMRDVDGLWENGTTPDFIEFCNAYKEAKQIQKEFLISIGLAGAAPSPFAIFTAKNVTDMRDKIENEVTHKGKIIYLPPKKQ